MQDGIRGEADVVETPKPDDARLATSRAIVIGNNELAANTALQTLQDSGYVGHVHTVSLVGDVEEVAAQVVEVARRALDDCERECGGGPLCVILAGEATVRFGGGANRGKPGKGGRCSHMALLVARALSGVPDWHVPSSLRVTARCPLAR